MRKRTYFRKIILLITVPFLLFFTLVSIVGFLTCNIILRKQLDSSFVQLSQGLQKDVQVLNDSMKGICEYVYLDGIIYNRIYGHMVRSEERYTEINSVFGGMKGINSHIESAQFYNANTGELYCAGTVMDISENQKKEIFSKTDQLKKNKVLLRELKYIQNLKETKKTILSYFVYHTPALTEKNSFMVVNIDVGWIAENVRKYYQTMDAYSFLIYSPDRDLFIYSSEPELDLNQDTIRSAVAKGVTTVEIGGEKYLLFSTEIDMDDLVIYTLLPVVVIYEPLYRYVEVSLYLGISLALLCVVLSFAISKRVYFPFNILYRSLFEMEAEGDEFDNIRQLFEDYSKSLSKYEKEISKERNLAKKYAFIKLMRESAEMSETEIEKNFSYLSLNMKDNFVAVAFCVVGQDNCESNLLLRFALYKVSVELLQELFQLEVAETLHNGIEILLNVSAESYREEELIRCLQKIIDSMAKIYHADVSVGLSRPVSYVSSISDAAELARENLCYRFQYGDGKVFTESFVKMNKDYNDFRPMVSYEKLLAEAEDYETASEALEQLMVQIKRMNYNDAVIEMLQLIRLLRERFQISLDSDMMLENDEFVIRKGVEGIWRSIQEKLRQYFELTGTWQQLDHDRPELFEQIQKYIVENYTDKEACLPEIASHLGVSSRRLSNVYKERTNISFVAGLTKYRMEKAREYVIEKEVSISKIYSLVGISTDTYFYKLFKNEYGLTPTEYRKIYYKGKEGCDI